MSASRGNSAAGGADPAAIVEQDTRNVALFARQRRARDGLAEALPIDMMADPDATMAAIRAKFGDSL